MFYPFVTIPLDRRDSDQLSDLLPDGSTNIVYSGALGEKQHPLALFRALVRVKQLNPNFRVHVFSGGPFFEEMKALYSSELEFHSLVDDELLPELLRRSDIQIIPQKPGTAEGSLPSKLPNIVATRCRVLAITEPEGDLPEIINAYPLGRCVHSWDESDICNAIQLLLTQNDSTSGTKADILERFSLPSLVDYVIN